MKPSLPDVIMTRDFAVLDRERFFKIYENLRNVPVYA